MLLLIIWNIHLVKSDLIHSIYIKHYTNTIAHCVYFSVPN